MEFNADKCKVMHIGRNTPRNTYCVNGEPLQVVKAERHWSKEKPSVHCALVENKAGGVFLSDPIFHYRDKQVCENLHIQYVQRI